MTARHEGSTRPRRVAREAQDSAALRFAARGGYVASGVVHLIVGVLVIAVAFGGDGVADQTGAFRAIAGAPLGFVLLWIAAIALLALAVWQVLDGVLVRRGGEVKKWGARLVEWGKALVFLALGVVAAAVAVGARPDPDGSVADASRGLIALPGGPVLLGAIGIGILASGIGFAVAGVRRRYLEQLDLPSGVAGTAVTWLAVIGFVAKGLALVTVGVLLLVAAIRLSPEDAGGLDAAIDGLVALPAGPALCLVIGIGLIAYGVFLVCRSKLQRL
ncbi:hypothetical protein JOD63_001768 [Microbacterium terrae]|uniref:DUF1206 domain-containing protein n=1 Tax=Microbacterium terrae TaxID=69369 RepID=A0A0M2HGU2_9MICO|nr:DUF1206 domain-containing protein [Microbacterium terrae]KJL43992.1 hypothetical protein RS81_00669 [Microbacterium terrae]MBP1077800.1 hypothetical protein [Microbacterium terrae]GLJ99970.1 hypothetical protein GCM10017594_31680 [Microbacterium terrae]